MFVFISSNYQGVFYIEDKKKKKLATENLTPGLTFFNEKIAKQNNKEFRIWDIKRSKVAAALANKINIFPIKKGDKALYLGAAHGYTASYISDIIGKEGELFCLDFAPRVARELYVLCKKRSNMLPILADANKPEAYQHYIKEVDLIIQDIAQKNQVEILEKNAKIFLKRKGYILLALKTRSIDVTKNPELIFRTVKERLSKTFKIIDAKSLHPWERDHYFFVCQQH